MTSFEKVLTSIITLLAQTPGREKVDVSLLRSPDSSNISLNTSQLVFKLSVSSTPTSETP